ncbi:MAG TPA: selenium cofactor biosynthesis protein YqeC [Dehalococcoidia bacterium]|nr:selenium cofactor biosynthesis protein YqeC [Dehalococcoidia bacterium]
MDLTEALGVRPRDVVALVGGGGKTTAMYRLCGEAAGRGARAVASGTARFTAPAGTAAAPLIVNKDEDRLVSDVLSALASAPWVIAATGHGEKERLLPLSFAAVEALASHEVVELLVLEADGSALRPFKAPAGHEPVVPPQATLVVAVAGADAFGRPLSEAFVHRPERVAALTGARIGEPVTPQMAAAVLAHAEGGRKGVPAGARFAVLINKVTAARRGPARETARLLLERGVPRVVLAQARQAEPVVEVLMPSLTA